MNEKYLGCGCIPSGDSFCTWEPVFQDSKPSEIHIEVCDQMEINLGSDVKPVIGTAPEVALDGMAAATQDERVQVAAPALSGQAQTPQADIYLVLNTI